MKQVWDLSTQTECYGHRVVLGNWHCWEQPQVAALSSVLVAHLFARGTLSQSKSQWVDKGEHCGKAPLLFDLLTLLRALGKELCVLLLSIRLAPEVVPPSPSLSLLSTEPYAVEM